MYGNILEANGLVANAYGFSTKEYNAKSGLIYFGARYYDPRIGRFVTKDPLTWGPDDPRVLSTPNQPEPFKGIILQNKGVLNPDTIMNAFNPIERQELRKAIIFDIGKEIPGLFNRYVYVGNNPIMFIDPWGLCTTPQATQLSSNPFPNLPSFSESFPQSNFIAPVADIVSGGIEAGFATAFGIGAGVSFLAGPEFWPLTIMWGPPSIAAGWDACGRIRTGIQRLGQP